MEYELIPHPLDRRKYLPDPRGRVDRWFQARNGSNAGTTREVVALLSGGADLLLDPFAGAGSTAAAARSMDVPFHGIECDPVLAAIGMAKATAATRHVRWFAELAEGVTAASVEDVCAAIADRVPAEDVAAVSALAVSACVRDGDRPLRAEELMADLEDSAPPRPQSTLALGDCTDERAWKRLRLQGHRPVVYTSPPFGETSPRLRVPDPVRAAAERLFSRSGLAVGAPAQDTFDRYEDVVLRMLRIAVKRLSNAVLIMECEPDDHGHDPAEKVADAICAEFAPWISRVRVLDCGAFSWRGRFSLIVCDTAT